jgi:hypothetical protein
MTATQPASPPPRSGSAGIWLAAVALPVTLIIGVVVVLGGGGPDDRAARTSAGLSPPAEVAPLDLDTVAGSTARHYHAALAEPDTYRQIPCFCGCEEFLGHRDLYDCFVRADGTGWDAHAAGCGICIAESATVLDLLDQGSTAPTIRAEVIARYGSTPTTGPPTVGSHTEPERS